MHATPSFPAEPRPAAAARRHQRVLVVLEDGEQALAAVRHGVEMAAAEGAEVLFLTLATEPQALVVDAVGGAYVADPALIEGAQRAFERSVDNALRDAAAAGVQARVVPGRSAEGGAGVAAAAVAHGCALIVVAGDGQNAVMRLLGGSLLPSLVTAASVAVLICPPERVRPTRAARPRKAAGA